MKKVNHILIAAAIVWLSAGCKQAASSGDNATSKSAEAQQHQAFGGASWGMSVAEVLALYKTPPRNSSADSLTFSEHDLASDIHFTSEYLFDSRLGLIKVKLEAKTAFEMLREQDVSGFERVVFGTQSRTNLDEAEDYIYCTDNNLTHQYQPAFFEEVKYWRTFNTPSAAAVSKLTRLARKDLAKFWFAEVVLAPLGTQFNQHPSLDKQRDCYALAKGLKAHEK